MYEKKKKLHKHLTFIWWPRNKRNNFKIRSGRKTVSIDDIKNTFHTNYNSMHLGFQVPTVRMIWHVHTYKRKKKHKKRNVDFRLQQLSCLGVSNHALVYIEGWYVKFKQKQKQITTWKNNDWRFLFVHRVIEGILILMDIIIIIITGRQNYHNLKFEDHHNGVPAIKSITGKQTVLFENFATPVLTKTSPPSD